MTPGQVVVVLIFMIPVLFLGVAMLVAAYYEDTNRGSQPRSSSCVNVRYEVDTTPNHGFSVTMKNATGDTEQFEVAGGRPWVKLVGCIPADQFHYVSASIDSEGEITCMIRHDARTVESARSSGEFASVTCSG